MGKRQRGIGRLRLSIVFYGKENPKSDFIRKLVEKDLEAGLEAILIIRTALKVPGARRLVKELYRIIEAQGGLTVWISKDALLSGLKLPLNVLL